jgi:hypothetical protein
MSHMTLKVSATVPQWWYDIRLPLLQLQCEFCPSFIDLNKEIEFLKSVTLISIKEVKE